MTSNPHTTPLYLPIKVQKRDGSEKEFDASKIKAAILKAGQVTGEFDEAEAQLLESILKERDIPHLIRSYHDTAYDGIFQAHMGWGHVEAPRSRREEVLALLEEIRKGEP